MIQGLLYVMSLFVSGIVDVIRPLGVENYEKNIDTGGHMANTVIIIHPDGPLVASVDCLFPQGDRLSIRWKKQFWNPVEHRVKPSSLPPWLNGEHSQSGRLAKIKYWVLLFWLFLLILAACFEKILDFQHWSLIFKLLVELWCSPPSVAMFILFASNWPCRTYFQMEGHKNYSQFVQFEGCILSQALEDQNRDMKRRSCFSIFELILYTPVVF